MDCGGAVSMIFASQYSMCIIWARYIVVCVCVCVTHRWRPWVGIVWRWGTVLFGAGGGVILMFALTPVICRKPTRVPSETQATHLFFSKSLSGTSHKDHKYTAGGGKYTKINILHHNHTESPVGIQQGYVCGPRHRPSATSCWSARGQVTEWTLTLLLAHPLALSVAHGSHVETTQPSNRGTERPEVKIRLGLNGFIASQHPNWQKKKRGMQNEWTCRLNPHYTDNEHNQMH